MPKSTDLDTIAAAPVAAPTVVGQGTAVEQSRAVAQVQAAAVMAHQFPRSQQAAIDAMRDACGRKELAQRAFYKFARSGQAVTGSSVHLARELARIWGNIDYGLAELRRDDTAGQSELLAYAWDLETNARASRTFIIEHARDTKEGRRKLTELRDISDNNNNWGARNVREAIFAVLPRWFTDMAQAACRETLDGGGGEPLPVRVDRAIAAFGRARVTRDQLVDHVGAPVEEWTHLDVTDMEILYGSLVRKEITRDEAFPPKRVTVEELTGTPTVEPTEAPQSRRAPAEVIGEATGEVTEPAPIPELNPDYDDEAWMSGVSK